MIGNVDAPRQNAGMPPRRPAPPVIDVDALRRDLEAGRSVRVQVVPSATFPDGQPGRVRRVGDPERDGNDFIEVEVTVAGQRDVLPFAPADLRPPVRRRVAGPDPAAPPAPPRASTGPPGPAAQPGPAGPPRPARRSPTPEPAPAQQPVPSEPSARSGPPVPLSLPPEPSARSGPPAPTGRPAAPQRARNRHVPVVITVSSTGEPDASWEVAARVGAKVAVRTTPVSAGQVWQLVESLDSPALITAVRGVLDENRRRAEQRAAALADELAAIRAELDRYPPG